MDETADPLASHSEEGRYRLLVEAVTDYAIYMLDARGCVSSWNPGAQRFKGYTAQEVMGQHFSRFYTEEDRASGLAERALARAAQEGRFEGEGWRVRKDGGRFWAHVVIDPIRSPTGELLGYAKVTRDLTERRQAQHELEQAREALFQAQKLDAIGQLTGGVAHDFNNLLMVILSSLEMIRRRAGDDPRLHTLIDNAVQGAKRGASLTQRMLSFARRQDLQPAVVDVMELVAGMSDLLSRSLGPQVAIHLPRSEGLRAVFVDPNQLELALLNLAVNARDAMPAGGAICLQAQMETVAAGFGPLAPGEYVRLSVQDEGKGMDAATLARATEPFFTTKGVGKGTGLGLSMVEGLAVQSRGRFVLSSRPGQGTTAELWLPAVAEAPAALGPPADELPAPPAQPPRRVLVVDDDNLVLSNTVAMLEELGHLPVPAESGEQALAILRQDARIEVLLTDHAMPQMTGAQLLAQARQERPQLPLILATGYAEPSLELPAQAQRLGKPFGIEALARAIHAAQGEGVAG